MSDYLEIAPQNAEQVRARAADWLARRVSESWSDEDQAELDTWLEEKSSHRIAFLRVNAAWSHTHRLAALRHIESEVAISSPRKRNWTVPLGIAASLAVVAVLGAAAAFISHQPQDRIFTTPIGARR